jgi:HSP20 family molecular chaperone IbpA
MAGFFWNFFRDFENFDNEFERYWTYILSPTVRTKNVGHDFSTREPYTDIIKDEDNIIVTIELPGMDKKEIKINTTNKKLEIRAENKNKKYYKSITFKEDIDPENTKATYNNGVLEIKIKTQPPKPEGTEIKIN